TFWQMGADTATTYNNAFYIYNGSERVISINRTGNVGIGTTDPQRKLHISDVMRLEPRADAPADPASGDIYVDSTPDPDELCFYDGTSWQGLSSGTDGNCV
ncbi:hypothetical protein JW711_06255, partial [Candidatus Woesearchaeota archaeon]|nr:hypothetical protein [Candidatus Woesearchaeota archaeon]